MLFFGGDGSRGHVLETFTLRINVPFSFNHSPNIMLLGHIFVATCKWGILHGGISQISELNRQNNVFHQEEKASKHLISHCFHNNSKYLSSVHSCFTDSKYRGNVQTALFHYSIIGPFPLLANFWGDIFSFLSKQYKTNTRSGCSFVIYILSDSLTAPSSNLTQVLKTSMLAAKKNPN